MLSAFGVDVLDPRTTPRRITVLGKRLPPQALNPGHEWSTEAELLALLIDHVANLTYITVQAAGGKTRKPQPIPRPRDNHRDSHPGQSPGQTSGWFEAAAQLAKIPGVQVKTDGL